MKKMRNELRKRSMRGRSPSRTISIRVSYGMKKILRISAIICFISLFLVPHSHALDVNREVLDNGLTLLVSERHNLPVVKVSIGFKAGTLVEPGDKAGLANLTASLLSSGTKSRTAEQISEEADFVGAFVGGSGGDDYVTVSLSVLKKDVDLGFDLLSDIILNPSFPEDEISKKIERIKGSLRSQEEDPGFISSREFKKAVFGAHPYGRLVTGTVETLDRIGRNDIVSFHSLYYIPNNAIMAVVGDISGEEVHFLLNRYFSKWRAKGMITSAPPLVRASKKRETIMVNKDLTQANIMLGHLGVSRDHPDYYTLSVMNYILGGGGFASRLMENIREEKGLVYDIHSSFAADRYGGRFRVSLQTKNKTANEAIENVLDEINRIRSEPVNSIELSDAKSFLTGSFPMRIETSSRIARFLLAVEYYGLGIEYIDNYPEYINGVTKEDVLRVAKKHLDPDNYTLVVVANQEKAALKEKFRQ
jgi:zinc protease